MVIKLENRTLQIMRDALDPPTAKKKMILQSDTRPVTYYLVIDDKVICWSEDKFEIDQLYNGAFVITDTGVAVETAFEFAADRVTMGRGEMHPSKFSRTIQQERERQEQILRAAERFKNRLDRTRRRVSELLRSYNKAENFDLYRTRHIEFVQLKTSMGISQLDQCTEKSQLDRIGKLIGSWVLKDAAYAAA